MLNLALRCDAPGTEDMLGIVGLEWCKVVDPVSSDLKILETALATLPELTPEGADLVKKFLNQVVWVAPKSQGSIFSSTSFYELPGHIFFTRLFSRHIAPDVVFSAPVVYAVQENLYHEAIHQQLIAAMEQEDILHRRLVEQERPKIYAAWRDQNWDLEHAIQAFAVYEKVMGLRAAQNEREPAKELAYGAQIASQAADALAREILAKKHYLTVAGLQLFENFL